MGYGVWGIGYGVWRWAVCLLDMAEGQLQQGQKFDVQVWDVGYGVCGRGYGV